MTTKEMEKEMKEQLDLLLEMCKYGYFSEKGQKKILEIIYKKSIELNKEKSS